MTLIGLDLNATRARAVQGEHHGAGSHVPFALALDGHERELLLALSLEGRHPGVGRAGVALCRRSPHLACLNFLPFLGTDRLWAGGRHRLDATGAFALVCEHLQRRIGRAEGITVAVPAYLTEAQAALLANVAGRARWRLLGSVPSPIAVALAAHEHLPWSGQAVVVDLDDHALTFSAVAVENDSAHVVHVHPLPPLARGAWLSRLLDGAALRCIRLSRRDPRESGETEQGLFDQLAVLLGRDRSEELTEMVVQTPHWYQHLKLGRDDLSTFCAPLVQRSVAELQQFLIDIATGGSVGAVLLTGSAARLPGLAGAIDELVRPVEDESPADDEEADFGEDLIEENLLSARVHVLDDDAVARAAFDLALRQQRGTLPRGHLDRAPLPGASAPGDPGPARLPFPSEDQPPSHRGHRERHKGI